MNSPLQLQGIYTALVTPFRAGQIDFPALEKLIEEQIAAGVSGVVPVGTTGESPTLTHQEHIRVIEQTIKFVRKRIQVIAGTGSNSTQEAIELTQEAQRKGADAVLLVAPYYNKPTQSGLIAHFTAIAKASPIPQILYSIPSRCGIEIAVETVATLARTCPNIIGIKEAGGSVDRVSQLRQVLSDSFVILSGDDSLTLPFLSVGARGVISVASNLIPRELVSLWKAWNEGRITEAEQWHRKLYPLFRDLFIETNPVPIKMALSRKGWMTPEVRLPLVPMQQANYNKLEVTLKMLGL
ncbi:MAG: 4-hydroxy-tetrahydrodipicolinate synthase [Methylacidiphilales bacterium]|nr:4-hydroxy-tetrahydrodipicolinate synthase [Candidatus Methylacidiphilales bacterium]MDW8348868.1 4-hydroxy-tetrahydrodipicolinate synthase [Verrucomicrobiae bacterium]